MAYTRNTLGARRADDQATPAIDATRVLIVDDDPENREALGALLSITGFDVTLAASVEEACEALSDRAQDVMVSDLVMPDEDGFSLIRRIRRDEETSGAHLMAIAITAMPDLRPTALAAGFDVCFVKPVPPADVVALVAGDRSVGH